MLPAPQNRRIGFLCRAAFGISFHGNAYKLRLPSSVARLTSSSSWSRAGHVNRPTYPITITRALTAEVIHGRLSGAAYFNRGRTRVTTTAIVFTHRAGADGVSQ